MDEFTRFVFGVPDHEHPEAKSTNPKDYPRSVEITDDDDKMSITQMKMNSERQLGVQKKIRDLVDDLNMLRAERQVIEVKFWRGMREKHPKIAIDSQCGIGFREVEGRFWLVSWGGNEVHNQPLSGGG